VGRVDAVELVTLGQRKGLGLPGGGPVRYAVDVDAAAGVVTVGGADDLRSDRVEVDDLSWVGDPLDGIGLEAQCSAHGTPRPCRVDGDTIVWARPERRVAPGQSIVLYQADHVVAGAIAR
jgi:tRNA-specific 2-thiouridylase